MKNKKSHLENLLEQTNEAYYWIGFLLADGTFYKNGRIKLNLAKKDFIHLERFVKFIEYNGSMKHGVAAMNKKVVTNLKKKFSIHHRKTYNPIVLPKLPNDFMYSLIIGFIDGDGCITKMHNRKDNSLRIKCHSSWLQILNDFSMILFGSHRAKINSLGYSEINVVDNAILKKIKTKVLSLNIPYLERKWDKIDLSYNNRTEKAKYNLSETKRMLNEGITNSEIAKSLNLSKSAITGIIKRNNISK